MNKTNQARLSALEPSQRMMVLSSFESAKAKVGVYALLALFTGWIGGHHFYLGRVFSGVLCVLLSWTFLPAAAALIELCFSAMTIRSYNDKLLSKQLDAWGLE